MTPVGEADFLVVVEDSQVGPNRHMLRSNGVVITPEILTYLEDEDDDESPAAVMARRTVNVALLGVLSAQIDIPEADWLEAIRANLGPRLHDVNIEAFYRGRGLS
jgi:indolepyruvate ferredoxin oxidoreductase beta subunit